MSETKTEDTGRKMAESPENLKDQGDYLYHFYLEIDKLYFEHLLDVALRFYKKGKVMQ